MLRKNQTLGKIIKMGEGGVPETIAMICKQFQKSLNSEKAKQIAFSLKGKTLEETCTNLRSWIKANIRYINDPDGKEWVKTADATMRDGTGDCEDMTILAGAALWHLYPSERKNIHSNVVAMDGKNYYSHIFLTAGNSATNSPHVFGFSLDVVPPLEGDADNTDEINITKNYRLSLKDMEIYAINGLTPTIDGINAIAGVSGWCAPNEYTKDLQAKQSDLAAIHLAGLGNAQTSAESRKVYTMIKLNGTVEQEILAPIMDLVKDITPSGVIVWQDYAPLESVAKYIEQARSLATTDENGVSGIGFLKTPIKKALSNVIAQVKNTAAVIKASPVATQANKTKIGTMIQNAANAVKTGVQNAIKNPIQTIAHIFPVTVIMRNGLLLAMRTNLRGMASKFAYYWLNENEAASKGLSVGELKQIQSELGKAVNIFVKAGGIESNLKAAAMKGKDKKPLFGTKKGIKGIGVAGEGAFATILTALPIIGKFLGSCAAVLGIFKKSKDENAKVDSGDENDLKNETFSDMVFDESLDNQGKGTLLNPQADGFQNAQEQSAQMQHMNDNSPNPSPSGDGNANGNSERKPEGKDGVTNNTFLYVGIAAVAAVGLVMLVN
jgi:hypothetical protein